MICKGNGVLPSTHFHFPLDHMHISSPLHFHFSEDHEIYLHRTLVERFAEESVSSPIFPLGINQPSGKVPTLSNQHLCELSKYFIQPPFLCLFKLTFNFSNPTSYLSGKKPYKIPSRSGKHSTPGHTISICVVDNTSSSVHHYP